MVHSPNYHRLKEFMEAAKANKGLDAWNDEHNKTIKGFEQAVERLKAYRDGHGFKGEAAKAMDNWVNQSIARIEGYRSRYEAKYQTYQDGRATMAKALDEAGSISDTLVDPVTAALGYAPVVPLPSSSSVAGIPAGPVKFTTGAAYVAGVEAQNNIAREAACDRILSMLNDDLRDKSQDVNPPKTRRIRAVAVAVATTTTPAAVAADVTPVAAAVTPVAAAMAAVATRRRTASAARPAVTARDILTASTSHGGARPTRPLLVTA